MTIQLEAIDPPAGEDRKAVRRCEDRHPDVGKCYRRAGHDQLPDADPWHHGVTGADPLVGEPGQHWRWKRT